jgi:hypothetical protein
MLSRRRNQFAVPLVTALGASLFLVGCTDPPNPSGIYKASLSSFDPLAKELAPTGHPSSPRHKGSFSFSIEFTERDAKVSEEPQRDVKHARYHAAGRYASKDPVGDARLLKDYADAEEVYKKSWEGDWPQKEVYHARSLEAYQRLSHIVFGTSEHGAGTAEVFLKDRKVVCDLDMYRQSAEPLPPGMACRLPRHRQVRIDFRIEQNGDLVVESNTSEHGPPTGLRFTKYGS